jgi:putative aldouronate transport system substrate-binding protein
MKTKRKMVMSFFASLLFVFLLAACGGKKPSPAADAGAATGGGEGWFAGKDFSKHVDIEFADVMIDASRDYNNGDDFVKQWTQKFNITYNLTPLTFENWAERLRVWINSGDAPEMFVWNYIHGEAINYAEQGMVKKLPDGWKTKYPNLAKAQDNVPLAALDEKSFGGTYYLFRPLYANNRPTRKLSDHVSLYIRKDWAEAVGVELKDEMTITELFDFARKVKAADPGKVGPQFAPIVCRTGWLNFVMGANNAYSGYNNTPPFYKGADNQYKWGPGDPSTLEALKQLNAAWKEGLLDKEFYNIQDPDDLGAFYTVGRAAAVIADGMAWRMTEFDQHLRRDQNLAYDDTVKVMTLLGNDGYYHGQPLYNYWGVIGFSPNIDDEKLDRILQMFDYSCTDEGQLILRCGIEGTDWELDSDGNVVSKLPPGASLWEKYAMLPVYVNMLILSDDFQFSDPNYNAKFRERTKQLYHVREDNSTDTTFPPEPDWTVIPGLKHGIHGLRQRVFRPYR